MSSSSGLMILKSKSQTSVLRSRYTVPCGYPMGTPDEYLHLPSVLFWVPRFSHSTILFPVTGSQVLSHLSLFHFLQHCAILGGCQISAIPFSESLSYSCELKEPSKLSHPPSSGDWVDIWPRPGYSWCLWQTDAKVTSHSTPFLVLMPLGGPLSLSVGGTCDLLQTKRKPRRWWDTTPMISL